jgi:hypothetical protein
VSVKLVRGGRFAANVAVTERAWLMETWQLPVPEQSPDQPATPSPGSGVAAWLTTVPASKLASQAEPQPIPAGLELTWPAPAPCFETVRANDPRTKSSSPTEACPS